MRPEHTCTGRCYGCYETGYDNGESSRGADFDFWLHDELMLPNKWSTSECEAFIVSIVDRYVDWDLLPDRYPRLVDEPPVKRSTASWEVACDTCGVRMYGPDPAKVGGVLSDHMILNSHASVTLRKVRD